MVYVFFPLSRSLLATIALSLLPVGAIADAVTCPGTQVKVQADTRSEADALCERVKHSLDTLAACNVPLAHPVTIELRDALSPGCMGVYHCGEELIELLAPDAMEHARNPDSRLAFVDTQTYFQSIMTHELAHAAFEATPCPFDTCLATNEYLAHVMQVMSLPLSDRATFEAALDMQTPVGRDSLNSMIYLMAPNVFLSRAWIHLNQRPDACGYIDDIMQGRVIHDHERFE